MSGVAARARAQGTVWWLARATTYERNHGGDFAPSTPVSSYTFGWNKNGACFVLEHETRGVVHPRPITMPMPVELAEMFLLRCRDQAFQRRMLVATCEERSQCVQEMLEHEGFRLMLKRGKDESDGLRLRLPTLALELRSTTQSPVGFFFSSDLRESLGKTVAALSEDEIKQHVRA